MIRIQADTLFGKAYATPCKAIMRHTYERFTFAGGRASGKSSFCALMLVALLVNNPEVNAVVLRKTANTLRRSVFEQVVWAIRKLGVSEYFKVPKSNTAALPIVLSRDGKHQQILFAGCDDPEKLKSLKSAHGYFGVLWIEEKTEFEEAQLHNATISILRGGDKFWTLESYNPPSAARHWCNSEERQQDANRLVVRTTYKDVPPAWLGDAVLHDIERTKATNERLYRNMYLGEATGSGLNVFENIRLEAIPDEAIKTADVIYRGVDWGYYPDPFQYVACFMSNKTLYIFDELRLYKAGNLVSFERTAEHIENTRARLGYIRERGEGDAIATERITCDSAEPKSVADWRAFGANARGAIKGVGSRERGYKWLQSLDAIVIDPSRCPRCADEFSLLEFDTDRKTGEVLTGYPAGQPDHTIDAVRYALESVYKRGGA